MLRSGFALLQSSPYNMADHRGRTIMKDKLVITLICASAIAVALAAPSRAQG
jgi:hypothetical protein